MKLHTVTIVSIILQCSSSTVSAFYSQQYTRNAGFQRFDSCRTTTTTTTTTTIYRKDTNNPYDEGSSHIDDHEKQSTGIPALPPIGESSSTESFRSMNLHGSTTMNTNAPTSTESKKMPVAFVGSKKFEMQYTCNVCHKRNSNKVSRLAYTKGVVIAVCKGCGTKHLIADNLGWSTYIGGFETGETNIEEFLEGKGRSEDVNRVDPTVWELENTLAINDDDDTRDTKCIVEEDNTFE